MTAIENQNFTTYQGDNVIPIFTVYGSDLSTIVDLSTVTQIEWFCMRLVTPTATALLTKTKTAGQITFVTDGTDGKFQVSITATDTTALDGLYVHYARITDANGNVTTIEVGRMRVGPRPQWSYDAGSVGSSDLYAVRRLIGDVVQDDPQIFDGEILFFLTQRSSIYGAAAMACQAIAAQYSRKVNNSTPGGLQTQYAQQAEAYAKQAQAWERYAATRGSGISPYAGGIEVSDKVSVQSNTNRVRPSFNIGMTDNILIPVAPVGNETPTQPFGNPSQGSGLL